jgi:hypothetical protein
VGVTKVSKTWKRRRGGASKAVDISSLSLLFYSLFLFVHDDDDDDANSSAIICLNSSSASGLV